MTIKKILKSYVFFGARLVSDDKKISEKLCIEALINCINYKYVYTFKSGTNPMPWSWYVVPISGDDLLGSELF